MLKTFYVVPAVVLSVIWSQPAIAALSAVEIGKIAKQVTVLIKTDQVGSGVIVCREKNTYYVLTAKHVIDQKDKYTIVTADEQEYPLDYNTVEKLPDVDLAIATFTSDRNYNVAKIGNSNNAPEGTSVYVAGFPKVGNAIDRSIYQFTPGQVTANASKPLAFGYGLVYTNKTLPGMSGGAVLDDNAQLVAIHGRAEGGSLERQTDTIYVKTGFNLGIPINTFIQKSPKLASGFSSSSFGSIPPVIKSIESGADNFFLQAGDKYQKGDVNGAIKDLNQALRLNPRYAAAYSKRGILNYVLRDQDAAISDFNKALRLNPSDAMTYVGRGLALSAIGSKREAIADYTEAINYNSLQGSAYYNRGVLFYNMGDTLAAMTDLRKAAEIFNSQGDDDEYKRAMETIAIALKTCRQAIKTMCDW
ncbi:trypsin-like serine protease with C-terminal PDZ domain [Synechococcus sp. PCC 7502]|uniref:tetratricopeptide repeat-containing S1 family peptidase n=1 Tax=Synechococcus sp. PCC 7502 TaxID=1173263 RepID=UPI00029FD54C|nr:serine protease [Synechococcus sp. PCC 7502]AFY74405.1 trypsin-like serine protease with C-terminal PDZ domain [Synechococcus sp. PCC 7502]